MYLLVGMAVLLAVILLVLRICLLIVAIGDYRSSRPLSKHAFIDNDGVERDRNGDSVAIKPVTPEIPGQ